MGYLYKPWEGPNEEFHFTEEDWFEKAEWVQPGGGDEFSNEAANTTLVGVIDTYKLYSAIPRILGYSWCDDGEPWELHRVPPMAHPFYGPQLKALSLNIEKLAPGAGTNPTDLDEGEPYIISDIAEGQLITRYGRYAKSKVTVKFGPVSYYMYGDDDDWWSAEYDRYTTRYDVEPKLDTLMAETDRYLYWREGPNAGAVGDGGNDANAVPGTLAMYRSSAALVMTWHQVPESYLFQMETNWDYYPTIPYKIARCIGKTNLTEFMGFPRGTLLCEAPKLTRKMFPWYSEDGRAFYYDVTIPFSWFDPTIDDPGPYRGYKLHPHRSGNWYYAVRIDEDTGWPLVLEQPFLQEAEFSEMFDHVLKP